MKTFGKNALFASVAIAIGFIGQTALADDIQPYFNARVNAPAIQADLEQKAIEIIDMANETLDMAFYDVDLEGIRDAMIRAQNERGVIVRFVTDNDNTGEENAAFLEGLDAAGIPWIDDTADGSAGSGLQHNKWIVADGRHVFMGSTNLTQSGVHGDLNAEGELISDGNDNHMVYIDSVQLSDEIRTQMDYMWGDGPGGNSDSMFGLSKPDHQRTTVYTTNDNIRIDVHFTPQSKSTFAGSGLDTIIKWVSDDADGRIDAAQFVISSQDVADAMELRHDAGMPVRGIGDSSFFFRDYSEFNDMRGVEVAKDDGTFEIDSFTGAPNNVWENPVDVRVASVMGGDKWHHKYYAADSSVLTGSHNTSGAASFTNDEAIIIIYDQETASEFEGHFSVAYCFAGGGAEEDCLDAGVVAPPETDPVAGTWEGVVFTESEVSAVLDIANNANTKTLDNDVGLDSRAARNISKAGTITTMDELAAVAYVGTSALNKLKDYIPVWQAK